MSQVTRVGEYCSHSTPENPVKKEDCDLIHIDASNQDDRITQIEEAIVQIQKGSGQSIDQSQVSSLKNQLNEIDGRLSRLENIIDNIANSSNS